MIRYPHTKNKEILITRIIYTDTTLRVEMLLLIFYSYDIINTYI